MTLYLSEADVVSLLPIERAIKAVEYGLTKFSTGRAQNQPRNRVSIDSTTLNVMSASLEYKGILGVKSYTTTTKGPNAYFMLFSKDGSLLSLMEADELGRIRTGATSGLATHYLARQDSRIATLIGTGFQAETQLKALCSVRDLEEVRVWSRKKESVENFCEKLSREVNARLVAVDSLEDSVMSSDIVTTATSSPTPVLKGSWLSKGTHINAVGNNRNYEREIDSNVVKYSDIIITDSVQQAKLESGDLILAASDGVDVWDRVQSITDLFKESMNKRKSESDITLFKSNGLAIEDVAVAMEVYELATKYNVGKELEI
jgi:alanine dehydrogenase